MIHLFACLGHDTTSVLEDWCGINATSNWTTCHDLLGHVVGTFDCAPFPDGSIRVVLDWTAEPLRGEGGAGASHILGSACPVHVLANAICDFRRAGQVWVGGVVRDACTS